MSVITTHPKITFSRIILTLGLAGSGLLIPALGLPQWITGPLVNALLILTVETGGVGAAVLVGLLTPLNALLGGVLPLPLIVIIPLIGIGNAILSVVYGALREKNRRLAVLAAAMLKFAWLYAAVAWLTVRPLTVMAGGAAQTAIIPASLAYMMQWPQLATALAGGLIALSLIQVGRRAR